jgi:hypothetical protein
MKHPYGERQTKKKSRERQPICRICLQPIWPREGPKTVWKVLDEDGNAHKCRLIRPGRNAS